MRLRECNITYKMLSLGPQTFQLGHDRARARPFGPCPPSGSDRTPEFEAAEETRHSATGHCFEVGNQGGKVLGL